MKIHLQANVTPSVEVLSLDAISAHRARIEDHLKNGLLQELTRRLGSAVLAQTALETMLDYISSNALLEYQPRIIE